MRPWCSSIVCSCLLALAGCVDSGPLLVPLTGHVTLDGQTLPGKHVQFEPIAGTPGLGAGATTRADGSYELIAVRGGTLKDMIGVPPGSYKVTITEPMFPVDFDLPVQGQSGNEPEVAIAPPGLDARKPKSQQEVPPKYRAIETTPLEVVVSNEGGVIDLKLQSKS